MEIATKLKVLLDENNIDQEVFIKNILKSADPMILKKILDETHDWNQLSKLISESFKDIYKWMNDEKRMDKLSLIDKIKVEPNNALDDQMNEYNNQNNSISSIVNTDFKVEFHEHVNS